MKKVLTIIALVLVVSSVSAQLVSKEDFEELCIVNVVEGLQGPITGLDVVQQKPEDLKSVPGTWWFMAMLDNPVDTLLLVNTDNFPQGEVKKLTRNGDGVFMFYAREITKPCNYIVCSTNNNHFFSFNILAVPGEVLTIKGYYNVNRPLYGLTLGGSRFYTNYGEAFMRQNKSPEEKTQSAIKPVRRRVNGKGLPIPQREVSDVVKPISMKEYEGLGMGEGVSNENNPRVNISLTDEEHSLVKPVNDLGFNMFRNVGASESILLSPMSMTYALGLIGNGAAGETRRQIYRVLGCDNKSAANINNFCRKMLTEAPKIDRLTKIDISNEFFSHKSNKLKSAFVQVAKDDYDTQFKESDDGDPLNFTLMNTIYFKGIWTDKFPKGSTEDEVFRREDGKDQKVPMMNQTCRFCYTENDLCQMLCMPYSNHAYQMIVMLPKAGKTVRDVAQWLTADSWEKSYDQMRKVRVEVKLPRFESSSEMNLTSIMSALGMPNAFNVKKADFSNLFERMSWIVKIKQLGHVKVDETGTEATVATALQGHVGGLGIVQPDIIRFHATHPFLYFVREWSTGAIFFLGQYMGI